MRFANKDKGVPYVSIDNTIHLKEITFIGNRIEFQHLVRGDCEQYINPLPLFIEYEGVELPIQDENSLALATCTWLGSGVLLLSWIFDVDVYVDCLDRDFLSSLETVKQGFQAMYPGITFGGRLHAKKIVKQNNVNNDFERHAVFYSGGVDSTYTLLQHLEQSPYLVTIYGADLQVDQAKGWMRLKQNTINAASVFSLPYILITSNMRIVYNEYALNEYIQKILQTWWWPGFSHGIASVTLLAPIIKHVSISTIYFASSFTLREKGVLPWGSDPTLEGSMRIGNCNVIHDGYDVIRQEKLKRVIAFKLRTGTQFILRVCSSASGVNCSRCHNCYLTMLGLIIHGEAPADWGFEWSDSTIDEMTNDLRCKISFPEASRMFWSDMQKEAMCVNSPSSKLSFFEKMYFGKPKKTVVVSCVYNEADIIESFCRYHGSIFDAIVLYVRDCEGESLRIIHNLIEEGLPIHLLTKLQPHKSAGTYKASLVDFAFNALSAEWVFPLDPDEFVCHKDGNNPREELDTLDINKEYRVRWRTAIFERIPDDNREFVPATFNSFRSPEYERFSKPIISRNLYEKYGATIGRKVHALEYFNDSGRNDIEVIDHSALLLAHYPVRSPLQMMTKIIPSRIEHKYKNDSSELGFHQGIIYNIMLQKGLLTLNDLRALCLGYALDENATLDEVSSYPAKLETSFIGNIDLRYTDHSFDRQISSSMKIILNYFEKITDLYKTDIKERNSLIWHFKDKLRKIIRFSKSQ